MKHNLLLALGALVLLAGCRDQAAPPTPTAPLTVEKSAPAMAPLPPAPAATTPTGQTYRVRGQVVEAPAGGAFIVVKHETIPDFMPAMQMRLPLANAADAGKLKPGDKIAFDMARGNLAVSNIETLPFSTELKLAR